MRVFKFGGASVKNAEAVKNVGQILDKFKGEKLMIVVSAMGKTTNALEVLWKAYTNGESTQQAIVEIQDFHTEIMDGLFGGEGAEVRQEINAIIGELRNKCENPPSDNFNFEYDQIVSLGEIISTKIIAGFLNEKGFQAEWMDARQLVRTNNRYREAKVDWEKSNELVSEKVNSIFDSGKDLAVTQGFLGHTPEGFTTTLGREGSDFTAAILAYIMDAQDVTIWKDVPGMLNADPKYFDNTVLLEKISFREAIELAYFGASVIHPKTIQPLKRKGIPLYIKDRKSVV